MKRLFILGAFCLLCITGCRQISNTVNNAITLQSAAGSVYLSNIDLGSGDNDVEGMQGKEVGDISPKTSLAPSGL